MKHIPIIAAVTLTLGDILGHPGAAQAQATTFTFDGPGDSSVVYVYVNGQTEGVWAGRYHAHINGVESNIFCTDFSHEIFDGDKYAANAKYGVTQLTATGGLSGAYYKGGLASALNAGDYAPNLSSGLINASQRADEVAYLAGTYLGATAGTFANFSGLTGTTDLDNNLAGVSLAIWDIVQDGGTGFSTGQVQLTGGSAGYFSGIASYYETQAAKHAGSPSSTVTWIQAPRSGPGPYSHKQDYATEIPGRTYTSQNPVPEPSSVAAFAFTGLFAAGLMLKARKCRVAV